jgi:hypothetical protein
MPNWMDYVSFMMTTNAPGADQRQDRRQKREPASYWRAIQRELDTFERQELARLAEDRNQRARQLAGRFATSDQD